ncbi:hypothetical protein LUZ61_022826 [Rhynchospora tenuis]|nr:hypothetical protein LUZ61_022826 [Rhynchospora tenuis]
MRRLFLSLFHKQIFPSTPITSFFLFLLYIVVTPLMIGFEKDFSCHYHLGLIWIPPLFSFPPEPFPRNDKESGTLELYYFSASCLPKILLLQLLGHRVIQISCVFFAFPHVTTYVPIRSIRNGSGKHSIREPGFDSFVWYSFLFGSWDHIQQRLEQLAKFHHFTDFIAPNSFLYLY